MTQPGDDEGVGASGSGERVRRSAAPRRVRPLRTSAIKDGARIAGLLLLTGVVLLLVPDPFASGEVLLGYPITPSVVGHAPLVSLTSTTTLAGSRCTGQVPFTPAVGKLLGTTSTRGQIQVTLPAACRARHQIFPAALLFRAGTQFHGQIGLVTATWSGNVGTLIMCVAQANRGCLSRQITLTSATAAPLSTNNPVLISGNSYGPLVETIFTRAGTATVNFVLAISVTSAAGRPAGLVEQDWFQVEIVQL